MTIFFFICFKPYQRHFYRQINFNLFSHSLQISFFPFFPFLLPSSPIISRHSFDVAISQWPSFASWAPSKQEMPWTHGNSFSPFAPYPDWHSPLPISILQTPSIIQPSLTFANLSSFDPNPRLFHSRLQKWKNQREGRHPRTMCAFLKGSRPQIWTQYRHL